MPRHRTAGLPLRGGRFAGLLHRTADWRLAARARVARWKRHGTEGCATGPTDAASPLARLAARMMAESKRKANEKRLRRGRAARAGMDGGLFVEGADGGVDFFELGELLFLGVLLFDGGEALGLLEGEGA